eukprot:CAMPEP_0196591224 /NCGR_PEP_ID=MMETSP1081-20130531/68879_1 /TAXON_ID=36882 /ORGANISM="Pyramimonas amylifera, Strain CCMP720" /LENGTH=97 /DNA_ID=CAMNT_0041914523 /DNA_START=151 /DNA_END=444 /DNA_ORIENTATION=-
MNPSCRRILDDLERWIALETPSSEEMEFQTKKVNQKLAHNGCTALGKSGFKSKSAPDSLSRNVQGSSSRRSALRWGSRGEGKSGSRSRSSVAREKSS